MFALTRPRAAPPAARVAAVLFVQISLAGCGETGDPPSSPPADYTSALERTTLANGLEVVVLPNRSVPIVTFLLGFRAGAFVEDETRNGYSHLLEHMVFKGSAAVPDPIEYRDRLAAAGAVHNAYTSTDRVAYYFTAPSANVEEVFELYAGAIQAPALDPEELTKEIQVVFAEIDRANSDWDRLHWRGADALLFGPLSERVDALGSKEQVGAATSETLRQMHADFYVPNNGLLALSGDIDAETGFALAETFLGDFEPSTEFDLGAATPVPEPLTENSVALLPAPVSDSRLIIQWMGPSITDTRHVRAGELLSRMSGLDGHRLGGIVGTDRAKSARLYFQSTRIATWMALSIRTDVGNELSAMAASKSTLAELDAQEHVPFALLEAAKDTFWASRFYGDADPSETAFNVVSHWGKTTVDDYIHYSDQLYDVSTEDIVAFIQTYMQHQPYAAVLMSSQENLDAQAQELTHAWLRNAL